jgi:hypothetical protein
VIAPRAILLAARKAHNDLGDFLSFLSQAELDALSLIGWEGRRL